MYTQVHLTYWHSIRITCYADSRVWASLPREESGPDRSSGFKEDLHRQVVGLESRGGVGGARTLAAREWSRARTCEWEEDSRAASPQSERESQPGGEPDSRFDFSPFSSCLRVRLPKCTASRRPTVSLVHQLWDVLLSVFIILSNEIMFFLFV